MTDRESKKPACHNDKVGDDDTCGRAIHEDSDQSERCSTHPQVADAKASCGIQAAYLTG